MNMLLFLLFHLTVAAHPPAITNIYRTGYEYYLETHAFYKLHVEESNFDKAEEICIQEGAKLATVIYEDLGIINNMFTDNPDIQYIWVGGGEWESEESDTTVVDKRRVKLNRNFDRKNTYYSFETCSFICKVYAEDAPYDETCGVLDKGFKYWASVGSCYKVSDTVATWHEAKIACEAVDSHLVVVNSEAESKVLSDVMNMAGRLGESVNNDYFIAGFQTSGMSRDFVTIFNQTLEEAGFSRWLEGEPNNYKYLEYCGALYKAGTLNDIRCSHRFAFICEKEVRPHDVHSNQTLKATPLEGSDSSASYNRNYLIVLLFCLLSCFGGF